MNLRPAVARHTRAVRSYGQYCPVARGAEIFATRWTPIIVRNLLLGCRTFGELAAGAPGIPRALLSSGCASSRSTGSSGRRPNPHRRGWVYEPTEACEDLRRGVRRARRVGRRAGSSSPRSTSTPTWRCGACAGDPLLALPDRRVTIRFELRDTPRHQRRYWLLVHRPEPEVCVKPPGFEEDLVVTTEPDWLARWVLGESSLGHGMQARRRRGGRSPAPGPDARRLGRAGRAAAKTWGREVPREKVTQASLSG